MNQNAYRATLALVLSILTCTTLTAQQNISRITSEWFQEERFLIADLDDDARLNRAEVDQFAQEFIYFTNDRQFDLTDRNQDGLLSYSEIRAVTESERNYRFQLDRRELQALARQYPLLAQATLRYLKDNPALVEGLFSNFNWMMEHQNQVLDILNDQVWTSAHPEVMISLHNNLRWMVANPSTARKLYRDRRVTQQLPQFLAWRADHQDLIRQFPSTTAMLDLDFIHAGIRIRG